jgi:long-chain fatty acid transport protein
MRRLTNKLAMPAIAAVSLLAMTVVASAGGFAIREQSAEFQGMSFAGNAAGGGGLSGMFWNPAVAGQFNGITTASSYAYIIPESEITALPGSTLLGLGAKSGNIGADALVPSSYISYQLTNHLVFGFSLNSPFGLSTEPANRVWAGMTHARTSEIKTYNGQAVLAYRVSSNFIVAAGVQLEHITGRLKAASQPSPTAQNLVVEGDDTNFGFTVGAIWNPSEQTSIGLGWRSQIEHKLGGNTFFAGPVAFAPGVVGGGKGGLGSASIQAPITMPDIVTLSIRHNLTNKLALLGTVEWTNWSTMTSLVTTCTSTSAGTGVPCAGPGAIEASIPFNWHDSWFVSTGLEYKFNHALTGRTGVAWEKSPIQNAVDRQSAVPDANRIWASVGATYKWSDNISFDLAYSHVFVEDSQLDRTQPLGGVPIHLFADVSSQVDIISAGVKIKLGGAEPAREEDSLK